MDSTVEILQESAEESAEKVQTQMNEFVVFIQEHIPNMVDFGIRLLIAILIFFLGRFLIKWLRKRIRNSLNRSSADAGLTQFTDSFLKISLYIVLFLIIAANLGIEINSISMLFASAGVGISLSLQQTLSNFAGGVLILLLKPFVVGDYIIEDPDLLYEAHHGGQQNHRDPQRDTGQQQPYQRDGQSRAAVGPADRNLL